MRQRKAGEPVRIVYDPDGDVIEVQRAGDPSLDWCGALIGNPHLVAQELYGERRAYAFDGYHPGGNPKFREVND